MHSFRRLLRDSLLYLHRLTVCIGFYLQLARSLNANSLFFFFIQNSFATNLMWISFSFSVFGLKIKRHTLSHTVSPDPEKQQPRSVNRCGNKTRNVSQPNRRCISHALQFRLNYACPLPSEPTHMVSNGVLYYTRTEHCRRSTLWHRTSTFRIYVNAMSNILLYCRISWLYIVSAARESTASQRYICVLLLLSDCRRALSMLLLALAVSLSSYRMHRIRAVFCVAKNV